MKNRLLLTNKTTNKDYNLTQSDIQGAVLAYVLIVEDEQTDQERVYRVDASGYEIRSL